MVRDQSQVCSQASSDLYAYKVTYVLLSWSPDPITNSETTNLNFHKLFDQLEEACLKDLEHVGFGIGCLIRWGRQWSWKRELKHQLLQNLSEKNPKLPFCTTIVYQQQISKLRIWNSRDFLPNWNVISFTSLVCNYFLRQSKSHRLNRNYKNSGFIVLKFCS